MIIYLVYEHDSFEDYAVISVTKDEEKAKIVSGEKKPSDWFGKENDETNRYYLVMESEKEYDFQEKSTLTM